MILRFFFCSLSRRMSGKKSWIFDCRFLFGNDHPVFLFFFVFLWSAHLCWWIWHFVQIDMETEKLIEPQWNWRPEIWVNICESFASNFMLSRNHSKTHRNQTTIFVHDLGSYCSNAKLHNVHKSSESKWTKKKPSRGVDRYTDSAQQIAKTNISYKKQQILNVNLFGKCIHIILHGSSIRFSSPEQRRSNCPSHTILMHKFNHSYQRQQM